LQIEWREHLLDACVKWIQPIATTIALIAGAFITYDLKKAIANNNGWSGPLNLIEAILVPSFIASALVTFVCMIISAVRSDSIRSLKEEIGTVKATFAAESRERQAERGEIGNVIIYLCDGLLLRVRTHNQ